MFIHFVSICIPVQLVKPVVFQRIRSIAIWIRLSHLGKKSCLKIKHKVTTVSWRANSATIWATRTGLKVTWTLPFGDLPGCNILFLRPKTIDVQGMSQMLEDSTNQKLLQGLAVWNNGLNQRVTQVKCPSFEVFSTESSHWTSLNFRPRQARIW